MTQLRASFHRFLARLATCCRRSADGQGGATHSTNQENLLDSCDDIGVCTKSELGRLACLSSKQLLSDARQGCDWSREINSVTWDHRYIRRGKPGFGSGLVPIDIGRRSCYPHSTRQLHSCDNSRTRRPTDGQRILSEALPVNPQDGLVRPRYSPSFSLADAATGLPPRNYAW